MMHRQQLNILSLYMTRLYFFSANIIRAADDIGILILSTAEKNRGISVVCERRLAEQLKLRKTLGIDTSRHLPEVLWTVVRRNVDSEFRILFSNMQDEEYVVFLYDETHSQAIAMRASDAVLLAVVADIPIYIDDNLFARQGMTMRENEQLIHIPMNTLSVGMLEEALQHAIEEERFEQASHLRDEIKRRQQRMDAADVPPTSAPEEL